MRPCALACVGERASGQAGKRTGTFILYVFSLFDVVLVYARILFVFFVRAELFDLFAMIESFFCFAFLFFFVLCLLILVFVLGSSS